MYDDIQVMEDKVPPTGSKRKFQLTINDVAHWAGIALDVAKDELSKYSAKKRIEIYDDYIIVLNIQEMKRTVDAYFSTHDKSKVRT